MRKPKSSPNRSGRRSSFASINETLTQEAVRRLLSAGPRKAVIAEAPPGAGKSTLTSSVANALLETDRSVRVAVVTQTNEQADDLVKKISRSHPETFVARLTSSSGPSSAITALCALHSNLTYSTDGDDDSVQRSRIVVTTARKWQYERARLSNSRRSFPFALIDEAYQMRSDTLLGVAGLFETLFCVGDPGQLDPFAVVDDGIWKGLPYSPSRAALATLREFHRDIEPLQLPTSWRLPPSAAKLVSAAFYPYSGFTAGVTEDVRALILAEQRRNTAKRATPLTSSALEKAAECGWAYIELPDKLTVRTDHEIAEVLADLTVELIKRGATVVDELHPDGRSLCSNDIAVIAAHNDQVHAVRHALSQRGVDPDTLVVSTANKIQGREYEVVFVWHPLAGRRDATAFHLEAGRMCVMLSRHRQACIVVGRSGATQLLEEFPDSDPVYIGEREKFPDGWQANYDVLEFLAHHRP